MGMNRNSVAQLISRARINLRDGLRHGRSASIPAASPECETALPLLALRQDGELDDADERDWLARHLAGCATCRVRVEAMQEAGAAYRAVAAARAGAVAARAASPRRRSGRRRTTGRVSRPRKLAVLAGVGSCSCRRAGLAVAGVVHAPSAHPRIPATTAYTLPTPAPVVAVHHSARHTPKPKPKRKHGRAAAGRDRRRGARADAVPVVVPRPVPTPHAEAARAESCRAAGRDRGARVGDRSAARRSVEDVPPVVVDPTPTPTPPGKPPRLPCSNCPIVGGGGPAGAVSTSR